MAYIELSDGTPLYYREAGDGRPLVLLQALMFPADYFWQKNIAALARTNRVIALDMRGQGQSAKPNFGYTIERLARDLHEVFEQLDLRDVTLAGLALGALVILEYYKTHGRDRLGRLALMDFTPRLVSAPGWEHPTFGDFPTEAADAYADTVRADRTVLKDFLAGSFADMPPADIFFEMAAQCYLTPTEAAAQLIEDMVRQDLRDVVGTITLPTLLIYGGPKNKTLPTAIGPWLQSRIAGCELVVFEESGHCPFWEEPDKFNDVLSRFAAG